MQRPRHWPRHRGERGFALLIVLWTLVLLALLMTHVAATGRREGQIASNLRAGVQRQTHVDGAVFEAAFRVLDRGALHWEADGARHEVDAFGERIVVTVEDTADAVNLNTATPPLLRALLLAVGADEARARELAAAIVDWREQSGPAATALKRQQYLAARLAYSPPEAPFRSVDELGLVVGMSPELLATLKPHLTVWSSYGPTQTSADPVVRDAMQRVMQEGGDLPDDENDDGASVLAITARAARKGASLARYAVLRLDPTDEDRPCAILAWQNRTDFREGGGPPDYSR